MKNKKKIVVVLFYVLFLCIIGIMNKENARGYDISVTDPTELGYCGDYGDFADGSYDFCSKTAVFKMRFYVNETQYTRMCRCNSPGDWPTSVDEGGYVDWASFRRQYTGYTVSVISENNGKANISILFRTRKNVQNLNNFNLWGNFQDILCSGITVDVGKPGYDKEEENEEIRDGRFDSFDINARSQVASVDNAKENSNNIYELTGESATINYRHELRHENGNFSPNVDYWNDSISGSTYVSVGNTSVINSSKIGQTAKLNINDDPTNSCQNISYRSRTWTYRYKQKWVIKYNVHYDGDGKETGRDKMSETLVAEYVDTNFLVGSNEGVSTDACAHLHRPWNFEISNIEIVNGGQEEIVNIGDTIEPKFDIEIKKHLPDYAITDIPNATIELCETINNANKGCMPIYSGATISGGDGGSVKTGSGYAYSYYNPDSYTVKNISGKITISDVQAGARVCAQLKVNPTDSGNGYYNNFNWQNPKYSEKKCYIVAKRPTVQVWGGNVVSGGSISTRMTRKKDKMFGSWGELGAIAGGTIDGFASGASLADGGNLDSRKLVGLSFANVGVSGDRLGGNFNVNIENIIKYKNAIIEKIEASGLATDLLPEGEVEGYVYIKKEGNLIIDRNIEYASRMISLNDMPKVFIYATGDIKIRCDVTRLDAILVAEGTVNTCVDENGETPDENAKNRSNQLKINGAIIANELNLNRTYGAAVGVYSDVPAEIINYDPTIELITIKSGDDRIKGLNSVYTHELAPRY